MRSTLLTAADLLSLDHDRFGAAGHLDGKADIGRDAYRLHERTVGIGSIVVSLVWLAFYVVATVHPLISGSAHVTSVVEAPASIALPLQR
jgi:hypothetical protein